MIHVRTQQFETCWNSNLIKNELNLALVFTLLCSRSLKKLPIPDSLCTQLFFLSNLAKHEKRVAFNWNQAIFHSHLCVTYPVDPMLNQSSHSTCTASLIAYHSIFLPDLGISSLSNRKFAINAKAFINRKPYKKVHQKKGIYWNQIKVFSSNEENPFWCKLDLAFIEWLLIL